MKNISPVGNEEILSFVNFYFSFKLKKNINIHFFNFAFCIVIGINRQITLTIRANFICLKYHFPSIPACFNEVLSVHMKKIYFQSELASKNANKKNQCNSSALIFIASFDLRFDFFFQLGCGKSSWSVKFDLHWF